MKAWAVINPGWEKGCMGDEFCRVISVKNKNIETMDVTLAIFETKKEAHLFCEKAENIFLKVVEVKIVREGK